MTNQATLPYPPTKPTVADCGGQADLYFFDSGPAVPAASVANSGAAGESDEIELFWDCERQDLKFGWPALAIGPNSVPAGYQVRIPHSAGDFIAVGKTPQEAIRNLRARICRRLAALPD
jgi:hypothetical protein